MYVRSASDRARRFLARRTDSVRSPSRLPAHEDPCTTRAFIGDYFGLAMSASNVYALMVSTHYPSPTVVADGGGPVYYQQQVLSTVPRAGLGN